MKSTAIFETDNASRYLKLLCQHFSRKTQVKCDTRKGQVQFPFGQCEMTAIENGMSFCAHAEDQKQLDEVTHIVASHLERFAFRENPELIWKSESS